MATIDKRETAEGVSYRVRVRIQGLPAQVRSFSRLTDAKNWAQKMETSIRNGEFQDCVSEARKHTFQEVLDNYKVQVLPNKAPSTQRAEGRLMRYWEKTLGEYSLSYITPEVVRQKLKEVAEEGNRRIITREGEPKKPKSKQTLKHYRDHLEKYLTYAKQLGWLAANPMANMPRITKLNNARVRFLDDKERKDLLEFCRKSPNPQLYAVVVFALSTGARLGEIMNLALDDVDLKRGVAILRQTKNGETRTVPIVKHLNAVLKEHMAWVLDYYAKHAPSHKRKWLFPREDCMAPIDIRKAWENARDKAGVTNFRFHDLRHSAASYLAMNGASMLEIAEVLGHKTLQMVKRYSHLSKSHTMNIVAKMNGKIFGK